MKGKEILKRHIGHKLTGGLVQSFYLNNDLKDKINVTFLKFDDEWTHITTCEAETIIRTQDASIETTESFGDKEFNYPIRQIKNIAPDFSNCLRKTLMGFKELILKDNETVSCGLKFYFADDINFVIKNDNSQDGKSEYYFNSVNFDDIKEK